MSRISIYVFFVFAAHVVGALSLGRCLLGAPPRQHTTHVRESENDFFFFFFYRAIVESRTVMQTNREIFRRRRKLEARRLLLTAVNAPHVRGTVRSLCCDARCIKLVTGIMGRVSVEPQAHTQRRARALAATHTATLEGASARYDMLLSIVLRAA